MVKYSVATAAILASTASFSGAFQTSTRTQWRHAQSTRSISGAQRLQAATIGSEANVAKEVPGVVDEKDMSAMGAMPDMTGVAFSGLKGKALSIRPSDIPTFATLKKVVPKECFKADNFKSFGYLSVSMAGTALCTALGIQLAGLIGLSAWTIPVWAAYSAVTGTVAMGLWVLAHECGHGAFSPKKDVNDLVGFILHSFLLVPYYSWQHTHAVHHRYTNDMDRGETHVPEPVDSPMQSEKGRNYMIEKFGKDKGLKVWGGIQGFLHLAIGWPAYLLIGATGGSRGFTNHYWPEPLFGSKPEEGIEELFPGRWKAKVLESDIGIAAVVGGLVSWGVCRGFGEVMALYGGPLFVVNVWLVLYTWLQHTDVDVPHFSKDDHTFMKGALHTIDRPYDKLDPWGAIDFLHHKIGTTHVAHHIDSTIPHYNAQVATDAIKENYPELYLYDDTPIPQALWRVARGCTVVKKQGDMWVWENDGLEESVAA